MRPYLIWIGTALVVLVPLVGAALSPLLAWRDPIYIAAGFAGILGFSLMFVQPMLALALLPGLSQAASRRIHRLSGISLLIGVVLHVAGLWITSPPDVIDALLFVSATSFSAWGVIAMWAVFATALVALAGRRCGLRWRVWSRMHRLLGAIIALTTVVHVALIDGTMDLASKIGVGALVLLAALATLADRRIWRR